MMESDISSREAEVRTLRQEVDALSFQAAAREEEHKTEVHNLSAQLEDARSAVVSRFSSKDNNKNNIIQAIKTIFKIWRPDFFDKDTVFIVLFSLKGKLNEQLRIVLEENIVLQKRLIKLERQYLKSMMKSSPITRIKGVCKCQRETHMNEHRAVFLLNCHTLCLHILRGSD